MDCIAPLLVSWPLSSALLFNLLLIFFSSSTSPPSPLQPSRWSRDGVLSSPLLSSSLSSAATPLPRSSFGSPDAVEWIENCGSERRAGSCCLVEPLVRGRRARGLGGATGGGGRAGSLCVCASSEKEHLFNGLRALVSCGPAAPRDHRALTPPPCGRASAGPGRVAPAPEPESVLGPSPVRPAPARADPPPLLVRHLLRYVRPAVCQPGPFSFFFPLLASPSQRPPPLRPPFHRRLRPLTPVSTLALHLRARRLPTMGLL